MLRSRPWSFRRPRIGRKRRESGIRPPANCVDIPRCQLRQRVHRHINFHRHAARPYLLADILQNASLPSRRRDHKIREIHVPSPVVNIANHQPRNGRDVAVPRPNRPIRVAIIARPRKNTCHRGIDGDFCANFLRRINRRIDSRRPNQLNRHKNYGRSNHQSLCPFRHPAPGHAILRRTRAQRTTIQMGAPENGLNSLGQTLLLLALL